MSGQKVLKVADPVMLPGSCNVQNGIFTCYIVQLNYMKEEEYLLFEMFTFAK